MNELEGVEGGGSKMGNSRVITPSTTCQGSPDSAVGKESACSAGDPSLNSWVGKIPREGEGYLFQYPGLENSMDCIVQGVARSWTQVSNFHFHFLRPGSGRPITSELCKYQVAFSV